MNMPLGTKDRPWRARVSLLNGESSSSIAIGTPVVLKASAFGASVLNPSSSAGATVASPLFAGIAAKAALPGDAVEIVAAGYCAQAKYVVRTRAASTDSYASVAARAVGNVCTIDTVNNAIAYSTVGAASLVCPAIVLLESAASVASAASTTSDSSTVVTTMVKVWVRALG